jgi:two-component system sensor histidine kinase DesK
VQHAATNRAIVELGTENGSLTVEIIDHGPGYDGQETPESGILGLRDRLQSVGGDLHLESPPGEGNHPAGGTPHDAGRRRVTWRTAVKERGRA